MYGTTLRISDGDRTAIADALRDKGEVNDLLVESRGESGEVEHILFSGRVLSRDGYWALFSYVMYFIDICYYAATSGLPAPTTIEKWPERL